MGLIRPAASRSKTRADGFTILEVVIALAILAVGLLGLAAMQLHALSQGRAGRHTTDAVTLAQDQMEVFQRMDFATMAETVGWAAGPSVTTTVEAPGGTREEQVYTLEWRIADDVAGWTKDVDVRVTWSERDFPNRRVVLSSRRFNW